MSSSDTGSGDVQTIGLSSGFLVSILNTCNIFVQSLLQACAVYYRDCYAAQCTIPRPSSGILILQSEVKPESSGCNELRYNLDADTIAAIFKTYPAGKTYCYCM